VLLNAAGGPAGADNAEVAGNETEWQMVINLSKSRLGGIGKGGLMEGEPRSSETAWNKYQSWIEHGKMKGAAGVTGQGHGADGSNRSAGVTGQGHGADGSNRSGSNRSGSSSSSTSGNTWVAEWEISFELMQIAPGKPYAASMADTLMGLNIAVGDVDTEAEGNAEFGLRHEMWPCGTKAGRTNMNQFCNFYMMQGKLPKAD